MKKFIIIVLLGIILSVDIITNETTEVKACHVPDCEFISTTKVCSLL